MSRPLALALVMVPGAFLQAQARPACDPDNAGLILPEGHCALLVGERLGSVRHIVVADNGDIYAAVGGRGGGGLLALRDTDGDGRADML